MSDTADRASLARLRRLGSAAEADMDHALATALTEPAFWGGFRRNGRPHAGLLDLLMKQEGGSALQLAPKALTAAIVLADLRKSLPGSTAKRLRLVQATDGEISPSARARFLRFLRTDDPAFLLPQARRLTRLIGREGSAGDLGASIFLWTDPGHGPALRSRWALDFFSTIPAEEAAPVLETAP